MADWKFQDPPNVAVIAIRGIVSGRDWIAYVSHDAWDGGWQFHTNASGPPKESDAAVVGLREIVELDPSVEELWDLPLGWCAWREALTSPWRRATKGTRNGGES
jgi:hypothetical protein